MWIPRGCENGWLTRRLRGLFVPGLALGWMVLPGCQSGPECPREIAIAPIQISTHSVIEVRQESPASAPTTQGSARDPVGRDQPRVSLVPKGSASEGIPMMLAVMTNGSLRQSGFTYTDADLVRNIRRLHGATAIILTVDEPGTNTFETVAAAVERLRKLLRENAPPDCSVLVYVWQ